MIPEHGQHPHRLNVFPVDLAHANRRANHVTPSRLINFLALTAVFTLSAMLTACASSGPQPAASATQYEAAKSHRQQLKFNLASGLYRCELGQWVEIRRNTRNADLIDIHWQSSRYTLQRYDSTSGLPRYEDRQNGLLWIDLPWKSVLMDTNSGKPLANECKALKT